MSKSKEQKRDEAEYRALLGNVRESLKTRQGKDLMWHVLSLCNLYSDNFTGNSQTFFLEGKRSVGLDLLQLMNDADPTLYPTLLMEHAKNNKEN